MRYLCGFLSVFSAINSCIVMALAWKHLAYGNFGFCCWGVCMAGMEYQVQVGLVGAFLLICMEDSAWCTPLNGLMTCICGEEWESFFFISLD